MKLLRCGDCGDVFNLKKVVKKCSCGRTKGAYEEDGVNAWFSGENATPIGFANNSFREAISNRHHDGEGTYFTAFIIPTLCDTIKYIHE